MESKGEEGDTQTLSRNHPLQEFLRVQQRDGLLKNGAAGSLEEFVTSYEKHLSISGNGTGAGSNVADSGSSSSSKAATEEDAATTVHFEPSPRRSSILGSLAHDDDDELGGYDKAYISQSKSPGSAQSPLPPQHIDTIVLKFTTLSDACSEAPSYTITTAGATIGRAGSNNVSVPSDNHLADVGHASIEFVNGNFFLVDGGCDFPASIRIGTGTRVARWHLEADARFSAGSSIFRSRGINEAGELVLDVMEGPLKGESRVIGRDGAAIGRASDNKLSVPDRELSRRHSAIEFDAKTGQYLLVDSGSTNGTYMQLVGPYRERYQLTLSDHILVGRTGFSINRFDYGLSEEMGHRQTMEDACVIVQRLAVSTLRYRQLSPQSFFGVYDGHGGAEASAYLSKHLHVNVADGLAAVSAELVQAQDDEARLDALVLQALKATFLKTDADFLATATPAHAQHGSTATTGLLLGQRLYCANVGDSRTLLCRNFMPVALSTDHKPSRQDEAERIRSAGGFVFNNRVMGELAVSRAFGDSSLKMGISPGIIEQAGMTVGEGEEVKNWDQPLIIAEPDIEVTTLTDEDQFLLLACDGLFDVFSPEDVIDFVRGQMEEHGDTQRCCQNLTFEAIRKRNSRDNVSVILIILNKWF